MYKTKLPADPTALILGIVALVVGIAGCCCYGITAIIPLGLSIGGLVMANKSLRLFRANPEVYSQSSYSSVNTAKVINIIAVILNGLTFLIFLVFFIAYGTLMSTAVLDGIRQGNMEGNRDYDYETYEWESDSTQIEVEEYNVEKELDSVNIDSTFK